MAPVHNGGAEKQPRMFASHRSVLDALRYLVLPHHRGVVTWLDVGCGRGQVLHGIQNMIGPEGVKRIRYVGCDGDRAYCAEAERFAQECGMADPEILCFRFDRLEEKLSHLRADFVSMVNVFHELGPRLLATTLCDSLCRLSARGVMHVHDMTALDPGRPELGAVCWRADEVEGILDPLLTLFDWGGQSLRVQQYGNDEARDWSLDLQRQALTVSSDELARRRDRIVTDVSRAILNALRRKQAAHHSALKAFLQDPPATDAHRAEAARQVCEHWTISAWLEEAP